MNRAEAAFGVPMVTLHAAPTDGLVPSFVDDVRTLLDAAFTDDDWNHAIGGVHLWVTDSHHVISHGSGSTDVMHPLRMRLLLEGECFEAFPRVSRSCVPALSPAHLRHFDDPGGRAPDLYP